MLPPRWARARSNAARSGIRNRTSHSNGAVIPACPPRARRLAQCAPSVKRPFWQRDPRGFVLAVPERVVGLQQGVDLARPLVDHGPLRVAVEPFYGILVGVAVRPVDFDRISGRLL